MLQRSGIPEKPRALLCGYSWPRGVADARVLRKRAINRPHSRLLRYFGLLTMRLHLAQTSFGADSGGNFCQVWRAFVLFRSLRDNFEFLWNDHIFRIICFNSWTFYSLTSFYRASLIYIKKKIPAYTSDFVIRTDPLPYRLENWGISIGQNAMAITISVVIRDETFPSDSIIHARIELSSLGNNKIAPREFSVLSLSKQFQIILPRRWTGRRTKKSD